MGRIGFPELIVIIGAFVLLFGARRLPEIGAAVGKAIREFKKAVGAVEEDVKKPVDQEIK